MSQLENRARALALLSQLAVEYKQLRICQILVNACGKDPFYMTDGELVKKLQEFDTLMKQQRK